MSDVCVECQEPVRRLQHAVTCDVCDRWQHRTCNTEHIPEVFETLADLAPQRFGRFLQYMRSTWLESDVWPVECWSVYGQSVRTNNDVEGWHRRLNGRAGGTPPFYLLVRLLNDEAQVALRNVQLVCELQLRRYQRRTYKSLQGKTFDLWGQYRDGHLTATGLLKHFSVLYRPAVTRSVIE